jgi:hypothetical protein
VQSAKALSINTIIIPKTEDTTSTIALQAKQTQPNSSSIVKGIDVFGTSQITTKQVRQLWGNKIIQLAEAVYGKKPDSKAAEKLYEEIMTGIRAMGDFAYVTLSPVMYYEKGNPVYVTVDIIDKADAAKRMQFRPQPTGTFTDPDNLLQQWGKYEETAFALGRARKLREGTASASEVLAAALQENNRAVLVGTKTYGRGRVHTGEKIFDDHILLFPVGTLKTPKGKHIHNQGI